MSWTLYALLGVGLLLTLSVAVVLKRASALKREFDEQAQALQDAKSRLQQIIDHMFAFVGFYTPDGVVTGANKLPLEVAGLTRESVIGEPFWETYWWRHCDCERRRVRDALARAAAGEVIRAEYYPQIAEGKVITIDMTLAPLRDVDGRVVQLLGFAVDITERKATEERLKHAMKLEALGRLAGGTAHDFNNLLAIIIGSLDVVSSRCAAEGDSALVKRALIAAELAGELTQRLLAFSRRERFKPEIVVVDRVIAELALLIETAVGETISLVTHLASKEGRCLIDKAQFEAALLNLALNARDAMPQGGELHIVTQPIEQGRPLEQHPSALPEGAYILVTVRDNGEGMSPDVVSQALEPYYTTKVRGQGYGLGLTMVQGFVQQSGGELHIDSAVGKGTAVHIYLPRYSVSGGDASRIPEGSRCSET